MRELILLRHAHAEPAAAGQDDIDRPLSRQGLAEAEAAGKWLKDHGYLPDRIIASPARRTRETLEQVLHAIGHVDLPEKGARSRQVGGRPQLGSELRVE